MEAVSSMRHRGGCRENVNTEKRDPSKIMARRIANDVLSNVTATDWYLNGRPSFFRQNEVRTRSRFTYQTPVHSDETRAFISLVPEAFKA